MPKISHILILLSTGVTVFLVFSAIKSGVLYQYDVDELAHTIQKIGEAMYGKKGGEEDKK